AGGRVSCAEGGEKGRGGGARAPPPACFWDPAAAAAAAGSGRMTGAARHGAVPPGGKAMPSVRLSGDWRSAGKMEWAGAPAVDEAGHIHRIPGVPEEAFQAIEKEIARGGIEGTVLLKDG